MITSDWFKSNIATCWRKYKAPVLSFDHDRSEGLYQYYKRFCDQLGIGIAMWSHPDSGYLMQPDDSARIAELPNITAIKQAVPGEMYVRLSQMIG
ncbi:MAG: hypothetical protein AB8B51_15160, partial [Sedimentitalea sp.]